MRSRPGRVSTASCSPWVRGSAQSWCSFNGEHDRLSVLSRVAWQRANPGAGHLGSKCTALARTGGDRGRPASLPVDGDFSFALSGVLRGGTAAPEPALPRGGELDRTGGRPRCAGLEILDGAHARVPLDGKGPGHSRRPARHLRTVSIRSTSQLSGGGDRDDLRPAGAWMLADGGNFFAGKRRPPVHSNQGGRT